MKKNNRRCESAMREMEMWSALALDRGLAYGQQEADALWKQLLLHQFHDILPGSCIGRVYEEAVYYHEKAAEMDVQGQNVEMFARCILDFLENSPDRVPFSDWYQTVSGRQQGFQNRTVQGGIFMPLFLRMTVSEN